MAEDDATISVFVVSLDENISPFADFCRHSACDLVESKNPVIMFGLHSITRIDPPGDVNMILGRWPRVFKTLPSLRDNLMDAVSDRLGRGHLVSIILVARSPDKVSADKVLKPILDDIALKRRDNTKLWSVGFFTCGPEHGLKSASAMVEGPSAPMRNVFFTSDAVQSQGNDLAIRDFAYLRFLIDLARSDEQPKKLFAESASKIYPKLVWFRSHKVVGDIYPEQLLQKLSRFFKRIAGQGVKSNKPQEKRFEGEIDKFLQFIKPTMEDETPDRLTSVASKISDKIPASTGFRESSIKKIEKCEKDIREIFQRTYQDSTDNVREQLVKADERIIKVEDARSFTLPGGGYTQQDKSRIEAGKKKFVDSGNDWTRTALKSRLLALGQHSDFQNRPDPKRNGSFEFDELAEGVEFNSRILSAHRSANDLPSGRFVWMFMPLIPVLLIAFTVLAHVISNGEAEFDVPGLIELIVNNFVASFLIVGVIAVPLIAALAWRWNFALISKHKIAKLRAAADDIAKKLITAAGNTSSYLANTRSALLAAEGARRISERVKEKPFVELQKQSTGLLPNTDMEHAELQEEQVTNKFMELNPPELWMSDQIGSWRAGIIDDDSMWEIKSTKDIPVSNIVIDKAAMPDIMEPIRSTYSSSISEISLTAIQSLKPSGAGKTK